MLKVIVWLLFFTVAILSKEIDLQTYAIFFGGNHQIKTTAIEEAVGAEHPQRWEIWKTQTPKIKKVLLPTLHEVLTNFYRYQGFYDANFTIKENNQTVWINITEGKPIVVASVSVESDYDISRLIPFEVGKRFQTDKFAQSKSAIIKKMTDGGYCSYDLETKGYIDTDRHTVNLFYRLKKGGICRFGKANIQGLKTIDPKIIKSKVESVEGERYSAAHIDEIYKSLYLLDSFESVIVGYDRKFYNVIPIDITLKETTAPYHIEVGVGYDSYLGNRVSSTLMRRNFLGNAQKLTLKGSWSTQEQLAQIDFYKPMLMRYREVDIDFGSTAGYYNLQYIGFRERKSYFTLYLSHFNTSWNLRTGVSAEHVFIESSDVAQSFDTIQYAVNEGTFDLFYPYIDLKYDKRDDRLNPKYGYYFAAYFEHGLSNEDGSTGYTKTEIESRAIDTFWNTTFAVVTKIGVADIKMGGLPESKYFFGGGSYSNRAYGYRELGVILSDKQNSIYGAASMANLSFEANKQVWGDIYGAIFNDNTMLGKEVYDFSANMISSIGVGVRYMTPIGPFKLDVGWNIKKTSDYAIAFQIGQSF